MFHSSNPSQSGALPSLGRRDFLKSGVVLASGFSAWERVRAADSVNMVTIGDAAQLFVDLSRVEKTENVKRVFHTAKKHLANPVLRKEKPWESLYGTWGTVLYDADDASF